MTKITEKEPVIQLELAESELGYLIGLLYFWIKDNKTALLAAPAEVIYSKLRSKLLAVDPDFDEHLKELQVVLDMLEIRKKSEK